MEGRNPMKKIEKVEKLDKDLMDKLFDGSITIKQANELNGKIIDRCNYIVRTIVNIWGKWDDRSWWDFDNEGGNDGSKGYFDPVRYRNEVEFTGEWYGSCELNYYGNGKVFPTKWIWEDFEEELTKEVAEYKAKEQKLKEEAKAKRLAASINQKAFILSALAKLTNEECRALGYRKPKE